MAVSRKSIPERKKMQQETAQVIALQALSWIATQDAIFLSFLNATGASASDLGGQAADTEFQGAILDFILGDDAWVVAFCDAQGLRYTEPRAARMALPGGTETNWT